MEFPNRTRPAVQGVPIKKKLRYWVKTLGDTLSSILCTYPADTTENRSKRALMILVTSMVNVFMRPRDQDGPGDVPELQGRADVDGLRCLRTEKT